MCVCVNLCVCVQLGLPLGSIKATVLIENVLATFEMEEILYELRQHSAGLNCGIWDYSASFVNKLGQINTHFSLFLVTFYSQQRSSLIQRKKQP